jgi:soluble lytic murein transglycosylase-like protein
MAHLLRTGPKCAALAAVAALICGSAHGAGVDRKCFAASAEKYGLSEVLLLAIARVESNFDPKAVHYDTDGTHDVGVMQINSMHFADLRKYRITEDTLFNEPCTNVAVGASILAGFVRQFGLTWRAVGAYGAGIASNKEAARVAYAALVAHALQRIMNSRSKMQLAFAPPATRLGTPAQTGQSGQAKPRMVVLE